MRRFHTLAAVLGGLALAGLTTTVQAQARGPQSLVVTAQNVTARTAGRSADVLQGDTVRYELRFVNTQSAAVKNVVFDDPIPTGMRYVAGTAAADRPSVTVAYSNLNVKIAGAHGGLSVGLDGATHQALEEISCRARA